MGLHDEGRSRVANQGTVSTHTTLRDTLLNVVLDPQPCTSTNDALDRLTEAITTSKLYAD